MEEPVPACETGNEYDGQLGLRISAIFVILVGSGLGPYMTLLTQPVLDCDYEEADHLRCFIPRLRQSTSKYRGTRLGLLFRQIFWFRGDRCDSLHSCEWLSPLQCFQVGD